MANISYGRSVKPVVKNNARTRRHMRRMVEAIECRKIEETLAAQLGWEPPARLPDFNRAELGCKPKVSDRVNKAAERETEYHNQIQAAAAKYVEHRMKSKYLKVANEAGRQIRAVQKPYRKSIPLV